MINSSNFSNLQDQNAKKKKKVNPFFCPGIYSCTGIIADSYNVLYVRYSLSC